MLRDDWTRIALRTVLKQVKICRQPSLDHAQQRLQLVFNHAEALLFQQDTRLKRI